MEWNIFHLIPKELRKKLNIIILNIFFPINTPSMQSRPAPVKCISEFLGASYRWKWQSCHMFSVAILERVGQIKNSLSFWKIYLVQNIFHAKEQERQVSGNRWLDKFPEVAAVIWCSHIIRSNLGKRDWPVRQSLNMWLWFTQEKLWM